MMKVLIAMSKKDHTQTFVFTCRTREYTVAKEISEDCRLIRMI